MFISLLLNKLQRLFIYIYIWWSSVCVCVYSDPLAWTNILIITCVRTLTRPQPTGLYSVHTHTHTHAHTHKTKRWKCRLFYCIRWLLSIVTSDGHKQFVVWCQGMRMFLIMNGTPPGFTPFVYFEMQLRNGAIDSQVHLWHICIL